MLPSLSMRTHVFHFDGRQQNARCQVVRFEWHLGPDTDQSPCQEREEHMKNKIFSRNNLRGRGVWGDYIIIIIISAANFPLESVG